MQYGPYILVASLFASYSAPPAAQRQAAAEYDTSSAVILRGTVHGVLAPPGGLPVCILLRIEQLDGRLQAWVVAGRTIQVMRRNGWRFGSPDIATLKGGETVLVRAYRPAQGSAVARELAAGLEGSAPPGWVPVEFIDALRQDQLAYGVTLTLPSGKELGFDESK
jgi:hypothetical protein